jgi:predicted porin
MFERIRISHKWPAVVAMALLGATAHAQSSVTLYGIVDAGFLYTNRTLNAATGGNGGKQFSLVDSGSFPSVFGITGSEDLGGGLKARFKLESGIDVANGGYNNSNGNFFGRQAWVALDGRYGTVTAGLQYSPFFLSIYDTDARSLSFFGSGIVNYVNNVAATGIFESNAVSYASPNIKGLQGSVMFSFGGEAGNFQSGRKYSGNLKYDNGTVLMTAAIYDGNSGGATQTPIPTDVAFEGRTIGIGYRIGSLTAKASFVKYKTSGSFNNNVYSGGLDYFVLPTLDVDAGVWLTSDRNRSANHSVMGAVGAKYFLSKRTSLYAQLGVVNNHGDMNTGIATSGALESAPGTTIGANVGIRHTF